MGVKEEFTIEERDKKIDSVKKEFIEKNIFQEVIESFNL